MLLELFNEIPSYHILLEILMALLVIWVICKKSTNPRDRLRISKEEEEKIISEWLPQPLVNELPLDKRIQNPRIINGKIGKYIEVNNYNCLNLATHNYLGMVENDQIQESAIRSIRKYGVGSCGPRGFYGTVDVHLELEERLAKFMSMEEAVVYSYGFSTVASAIPAYSKRGDLIFVDENVNFAIQKGLDASRSEIKLYRHNDMKHLESLLQDQSKLDAKNKKKAEKTRRFLIVEGIYMNSGDICPLPELIELRKKYKLRIFIDESISFGTLGKTGRGVTEFFDIPVFEVDLIMGSLECALGSIGGFCVGSSFIVEHQRLSGLGYCFSASLPPLLTSAAIVALNVLEEQPEIVTALQDIAKFFHSCVESSRLVSKFDFKGDPLSPVKHLSLRSSSLSYEEQTQLLEIVVTHCMQQGLALTVTACLVKLDRNPNPPSIRVTMNALLTKEEILNSISILEDSLVLLS